MASNGLREASASGSAGTPTGVECTPMEGEDFYTVQEAAKILRTTERTVRRRLERGGLRCRALRYTVIQV